MEQRKLKIPPPENFSFWTSLSSRGGAFSLVFIALLERGKERVKARE